MHSFTAGFKKPFRKKNKDPPKSSPKPVPKNLPSPVTPHRSVEPSLSSPLLRSKVEKSPESTNNAPVQKNGAGQQQGSGSDVPRAAPRPKRPPPPKPPAPYRKKSATYVQLEENSASQPENGSSNKSQLSTEKSEDKQTPSNNDREPSLYEIPVSVSQHSALETIAEGDKLDDALKPVAPPRRRKNGGTSPKPAPKLPYNKISLGRIPKVPSAPVIHMGSSSSIATHKTTDVVVTVTPPKYAAEELEKCSVSDQHLYTYVPHLQ